MEKFFLVFQELVIKVSKDLLLLYLFFSFHSENGVLIFIFIRSAFFVKSKNYSEALGPKKRQSEVSCGKYHKAQSGSENYVSINPCFLRKGRKGIRTKLNFCLCCVELKNSNWDSPSVHFWMTTLVLLSREKS